VSEIAPQKRDFMIEGLPEGFGVSEERVERLLRDARTIARDGGARRYMAHEYQDEHVLITVSGRQVMVDLRRPDGLGDETTQVLDASDSRDEHWQYYVSILRPGAWMDYVRRLAEKVIEREKELDQRAEQQIEMSFEPVNDEDLTGKGPVFVEQVATDSDAIRNDVWDIARVVGRVLDRLEREGRNVRFT